MIVCWLLDLTFALSFHMTQLRSSCRHLLLQSSSSRAVDHWSAERDQNEVKKVLAGRGKRKRVASLASPAEAYPTKWTSRQARMQSTSLISLHCPHWSESRPSFSFLHLLTHSRSFTFQLSVCLLPFPFKQCFLLLVPSFLLFLFFSLPSCLTFPFFPWSWSVASKGDFSSSKKEKAEK